MLECLSTANSDPTLSAEQLPHVPSREGGRGKGGGVESLEFKTRGPKGIAVVPLPCPGRVRTDVHGAVVDGFLTATVVWQWWA